jgi:hypothetical protein
MGKLIAPLGILLGAATWFLLFVILGFPLGTSFIAGGAAACAGLLAGAMALGGPRIDAPLTATGLLLGVATFVILRVVLSVPLWVDVVTGLGAIGLYDIANAMLRPGTPADEPAPAGEPRRSFAPARTREAANGHAADRHAPIGAR